MDRSLDSLDSRFRPVAFELIARCVEANIPVMIINTLRTREEQQEYLRRGVSWTVNSKHLPSDFDGKSLAIDLCPWLQFTLHGPNKLQWDAGDPIWPKIGDIGRGLGLHWGVMKEGVQVDPGHFEWAGGDE